MPDRLFRFCGGKFPTFPQKIAENFKKVIDKSSSCVYNI